MNGYTLEKLQELFLAILLGEEKYDTATDHTTEWLITCNSKIMAELKKQYPLPDLYRNYGLNYLGYMSGIGLIKVKVNNKIKGININLIHE